MCRECIAQAYVGTRKKASHRSNIEKLPAYHHVIRLIRRECLMPEVNVLGKCPYIGHACLMRIKWEISSARRRKTDRRYKLINVKCTAAKCNSLIGSDFCVRVRANFLGEWATWPFDNFPNCTVQQKLIAPHPAKYLFRSLSIHSITFVINYR